MIMSYDWCNIAYTSPAARDPRVGAGGSIVNLLDHPHMNHRCIVSAGLMADEAEDLLRNFFVSRRE